jgi:hypothetical protein
VHLIFYSSQGWEEWDVAHKPAIPERMPVLIDADLLFEDGPSLPRPTVAVNQWLRELPVSGCPAPRSWAYYARALRDWLVFLASRGISPFDPATGCGRVCPPMPSTGLAGRSRVGWPRRRGTST